MTRVSSDCYSDIHSYPAVSQCVDGASLETSVEGSGGDCCSVGDRLAVSLSQLASECVDFNGAQRSIVSSDCCECRGISCLWIVRWRMLPVNIKLVSE